ncbi:hypothetical protein ACMXYX_15830 [Neptuniibacter sp. QD72_48]|uniref:hypothetical protein n=1 Tax=Neptuniibacter sp. QD72_48 TaxID=3398214 RepID=UPI0039F4DCC1
MTKPNTTEYDAALLTVCKKYIDVTDTTPELFVKELMNLASQYIDHLPEEILSTVSSKSVE